MSEKEYKLKKGEGNGSGSYKIFKAEARYTGLDRYKKFGDQILTDQWTEIKTNNGTIGVPTQFMAFGSSFDKHFDYNGANAIRHWFLSYFPNDYSLETRLVRYEYSYSHQTRLDGHMETLNWESSKKSYQEQLEKEDDNE